MRQVAIGRRRGMFTPVLASSSVQAAVMVLRPGESSSDQPEDEHPKAEQWLYVIRGSGRAKGKARAIALKAGSLLLIEKREPHQIINTGKDPMVTLNFYAPPAYTGDGEVKRSVRG